MRTVIAVVALLACASPALAINYDDDPGLGRIERAQERMVEDATRRGELTPIERRRIALMDARNDHLVSSLRLVDGRLRSDDRARAAAALEEETSLIRELADSRRFPQEGVVHRDDGGPAPLETMRLTSR